MANKRRIFTLLLLVLVYTNVWGQCSGTTVSLFPATVNGVTVTQTYTGSVSYGINYTLCSVASGPTYLGQNGTFFVQKLSFSAPVNNILYILNASDSCSNAIEAFTFSVDAGTLTATQAGAACLYKQSGNTLTAYVYGGNGNAAYVSLASTTPYSSITVSGPGGCNGSYMALCSTSIGIDFYSNKEQVIIYPNPSMDGKFTVDYSLFLEAEMEITDFNGTIVDKYDLPVSENKIEIKSDDLPNGIYIYKISGNNALLKTGKIFIMK